MMLVLVVQVLQFGPPFGYFPNAKKTWLVVKEQFLDHAYHFSDTYINVTTDYPGAVMVQELSLRIMFLVKLLLGLLNLELLACFASTVHNLILLFQLFHVVSSCLLLRQCLMLDIFISHYKIVLDTILFQLSLDIHLLVT